MKSVQRQIDTRFKASASDKELTGEALNARIADIRQALRGWIPNDLMNSVHDYERFIAYGVLPYSGGYREQPARVQEDFEYLGLWMELVRLVNRLTDAKTIKGSIQDITGQRDGVTS